MVRAFPDERISEGFLQTPSRAFTTYSLQRRLPQGTPLCRTRVDFNASGGERFCVFGNREFPFCPAQLSRQQWCRDHRNSMGSGFVDFVWDPSRVAVGATKSLDPE